jgi:hypothetical protein
MRFPDQRIWSEAASCIPLQIRHKGIVLIKKNSVIFLWTFIRPHALSHACGEQLTALKSEGISGTEAGQSGHVTTTVAALGVAT